MVEQQDATRQAVVSAPEKRSAVTSVPSDWVSVLDKDISRVLVERGLTPYDSRVGGAVRQAGDALRSAESEFQTAFKPRAALYQHQGITNDEWLEFIAPLQQQTQEKRREVIERLSAALDALHE
jgi:hypothetical protein